MYFRCLEFITKSPRSIYKINQSFINLKKSLIMRKNQKTNWNDFLFENRNKAYGAYQIRNDENRNLLKSTLIGLSIMGLFVAIFSFTDKTVTQEDEKTTDPIVHVLEKLKDEIKEEKPPKFVKPEINPPTAIKKKNLDESEYTPDPKDQPKVETKVVENQNLNTSDGEGNEGDATTSNQGTHNFGSTTGVDDGEADAPSAPVVNNKVYNVREVSKVAVFPGCESSNYDEKALLNCMSKELQLQLSDYLRDFSEIAYRYNINLAQTRLNFVVDKSGRITQIRTTQGNSPEFDKEAQKALDKLSKKLIKNNIYIKAAELDDGSKVNMNFSLPIQFLLN